MIIRQESMFSYEEILNFQKETQLELILSQLDFTKIRIALGTSREKRGPKGYFAEDMLSALIAMHLEKISTVKKLVQHLTENPALRYACGFNVLGKVPSESTFSRFQDQLACSIELEELFFELVLKAKEMNLIEGKNLCIDSSKLSAYEASVPRSKLNDDGMSANWGAKRDTNGNMINWFGYKIHAVCDSVSELPVEILITPASNYDSTVLKPLLEKLKVDYEDEFSPEYITMDSGYDSTDNYTQVTDTFCAKPIIALNNRRSYAPPEGMNDDYEPICSAGYPLTYYGKDGDYLKFRCPHVTGQCDCPFGSSWCSSSDYGYVIKLNWKKDPRYLGYPYRGSKEWKEVYKSRTSIERLFSRLKEKLSLDNVRSRGINKVRMHALISSITLIAATLAVN